MNASVEQEDGSAAAIGPIWSNAEAVPLDLNGPDSAFRRFEDSWIGRPAIELFREAVLAHGERIACEDIAGRLTFAQSWAGCQRLAAAIDAAVPEGVAVGVLLPNEACYPIAVLGCLAAARPCVLIDRHYPHDRVTSIMRDAGLAAVVLKRADIQAGYLLPAGVQAFAIDDAIAEGVVPDGLPAAPNQDAPAFVVYTSGSTGQPKGIVLSQRGVLHRASELVNAVHLRPDDKVLSLASPGTIAGLQQIFEVMLAGATLVKLDLQRLAIGRVLGVVAERSITMMFSTPAVWRSVAAVEGTELALASLRCIQTSGDAMLRIDFDRLRNVLPPSCAVLSVYGATEAPALLQWFVRSSPDDEVRVPAGYPLAGFDFALIDERGRNVGEGEAGEFAIRSRFTSLGLWHKGSVQSGPFQSDATAPGCQIYRTGDLVRRRSDGLYVVLGRRDRQVKILGNRVELAEIETVLRRMPMVRDAAVIARHPDVPSLVSEPQLLAFVVPSEPSRDDARDELRRQCAARLASHMRPRNLFLLDELPLLPGRKIDEEALLQLAAEHSRTAIEPSSPPAEDHASQRSISIVDKAWRRTFGQPLVKGNHRFGEVGGDSLRLIQLVFHLERLCGQSLSLDQFHGDMRPSEFALALDRLLDSRPPVQSPSLPLVFLLPGSSGDFPLLARFRAECATSVNIHTPVYPDLGRLAAGTFDDIVTHILSQIEQIAPEGSIALAGYSLGGDVAYAVADQLLARGRSILGLLIFDTDADDRAPIETLRARHGLVHRFVTFCGLVRKRDWLAIMTIALTPSVVTKPISLFALRILSRFNFAHNGLFYLRAHLSNTLMIVRGTEWRNSIAFHRLAIPVILFRTGRADTDLGWQRRTATLTIIPVRGAHSSMFNSDYSTELGEKFIRAFRSLSL